MQIIKNDDAQNLSLSNDYNQELDISIDKK